jgi:hypothetical protein
MSSVKLAGAKDWSSLQARKRASSEKVAVPKIARPKIICSEQESRSIEYQPKYNAREI